MAPSTGLKPVTQCLEGTCSVQLSYEGLYDTLLGIRRGRTYTFMQHPSPTTTYQVHRLLQRAMTSFLHTNFSSFLQEKPLLTEHYATFK